MQHKKAFIGILCALFVGLIGVHVVAESPPYDETMRDNIIQNCVTAQVSLQQVQYNDAATRVNRGQTYEVLLSRYMTPLNTKTDANNYTERATKLIDITSRFQKVHNDFKRDYEKYDTNLSEIIKQPCSKNPEAFYEKLQTIRSQRAKLMNDVKQLDQYAEEYRQQVVALKGELK